MATGDMRARLLLDSKDFEKNIKRSKKDVDNFGAAGKAMGKELASQFKKLTAAALALNGATDVFKAFVDSSQTIGDTFRANVEGMKTVVDNFIYSIANADFTPFSNRLAEMFRKGKEAAAAADQFGNTQMAVSFRMATKGADYRAAMARARNKNLTTEERAAAVEEAKAAGASIAEGQKTLERDAFDALRTALAAKTNLNADLFSKDAIINALDLDADLTNKERRAEIETDYNRVIAEIKAREEAVRSQYIKTTVNYAPAIMGGTTYHTSYLPGYEEAMAAAQEANRKMIESNADLITSYNLLFRKRDEALSSSYSFAQSAVAAKNQVAEITTSVNEVGVTLTNDMAKAAEAIKKAAAEATAAAAEAAELNAEMGRLKSVQPLSGMAGMSYADTSLQLPGSISMLDENPAGRAQEFYMSEWLKPFEEDAKKLEDINGVVGMLGGSFSQLGSSIGGAAGNMLTFVGSALDAAQAIIPLIAQIMAESAAHKKNATAAATDAASKTLSAYAGIPFAGVALGVASVAAIVSAMQSIPKFAEGGIVNKATLGVFGEAGPEAVMPLDKLDQYIQPRELRVTGNIKASGKELVVVLDNYNRVRNG